MLKKIALALLALTLFVGSAFTQTPVVGTYYSDWSLSPVRAGGITIAPGQMTALSGLNLVVEFGDGNVISTPPYYTVLGGGRDSTKYTYSDYYNPDGRWIPWQDSLGRTVHRYGGKYLITIQAVDPTALKVIQNDSAITETFCYNAAQYAKRRGFDGLEVDEEYWQSGPPSNAVLGRFYRILRKRMDEAFLPARGIVVLTTGRGSMNTYSQVAKSDVDYVFFMLYDYQWVWNNNNGTNVSYYFSPLNIPAGSSGTNAASIVSDGPAQWASSGGWPKSKLVFGIPSYGFMFRNVDGIFQNYGQQSGNALEFNLLSLPNALASGGVQGWDDIAKEPYIAGTATKTFTMRATNSGTITISAGQKFFITFENQQSLQAKWDYIRNGSFGGIFLYDVGGDLDPAKVTGTYTPLHTALAAIAGGTPPVPDPTVTFSASPASLPFGGGSSTLTWSTTNAVSATLTGTTSGVSVALNGSQVVNVLSTTTFTLTATNSVGRIASTTLTVSVAPAPPKPTGTFSANPFSLPIGGGSSTLTWTSSGADSAFIDNGVGKVAVNGSTVVNLTATTAYVLSLVNNSGTTTYSVVVTVATPPIVLPPTGTFVVTPTTLAFGGGTVGFTWTSQNATSATITPGIGAVAVNGSTTLNVASTTTFTLTLTGAGGTTGYTKTVTVEGPPVPTGNEIVFDDAYRNGWNTIRSWTVGLSTVTTPIYAGTKSIKAVAGAWSSLQFSKGNWGSFTQFGPLTYTNFRFTAFSAKAVKISVSAYTNSNKKLSTVSVNLPANAWTSFSIPIAQIVGTSNYVSIELQTTVSSTYYLDNVQMTKTLSTN